jgi:hypothetical protein
LSAAEALQEFLCLLQSVVVAAGLVLEAAEAMAVVAAVTHLKLLNREPSCSHSPVQESFSLVISSTDFRCVL